jgi:hypothetical protein
MIQVSKRLKKFKRGRRTHPTANRHSKNADNRRHVGLSLQARGMPWELNMACEHGKLTHTKTCGKMLC